MISLASLIRLSVTPLMAETTTTTWSPFVAIGRHALGDVLDPVGVADRSAAVFLNNQGHLLLRLNVQGVNDSSGRNICKVRNCFLLYGQAWTMRPTNLRNLLFRTLFGFLPSCHQTAPRAWENLVSHGR